MFVYNRTYGAKPSNATRAAWEALFPTQGGFFKHPDLAPECSALSIFHQLHCLNGIREAYWFLFEAASFSAAIKLDEQSLPMEASPPHIRHCIDLIRQSLMCRPDITIEPKNHVRGGVSGFGVQHRCQDWGQVLAWVGKWENYRVDEERELYREKESSHDMNHHEKGN
ncbi:hypothetical protein G7Y89_g4258 [Cudoniella acicularis]|uniref:Uncharacterized protein n=1 Tax=Cudoniella acicularis TaxID=354080 RepID=A0A8H4RRS8_9HELO|nr:hypothetical protein G7Y89_g4258 [Cudoniella acicularis]